MQDEDWYYVVYGRQKPKRLAKAGVKMYLGGDYNFLEEADSNVSQIVKIPSKFTAEQARFLMKQTDPKYQKYVNVVYDKKTKVKQMELSRLNKLKKIKHEYDPSIHFIQIYDNFGNEYNWEEGRELRKKTGCASESIETYDLDKISNPSVAVFSRGESKLERGLYCVQKGKKLLEEKL